MNGERKWIVVTGASSGIGEETVRTLLKAGYYVVATARMERTLKEKFELYENVKIIPFDLSDPSTIVEYVKLVNTYCGPIFGLVHSAGIQRIMPIQLIKKEKLTDIFNINTFAGILLISMFSKKAMAANGASFVLISSLSAHEGVAGASAYAASKAALEGFARGAAPELMAKGIRINCIAPGTLDTPMTKEHHAQLTQEQRAKIIDEYPLGLGASSDIALFAEYLISEKASWITGQTFIIDGGHLVRK
jgi:NAD(P)-dependent dehydrogenase (short-subunit alcohol dehydrogenase family)